MAAYESKTSPSSRPMSRRPVTRNSVRESGDRAIGRSDIKGTAFQITRWPDDPITRLVLSMQISEIYKSLQGESTHAGLACVFVRLTGCNLRCSWCDSEYTFQGGRKMTQD